MQKSMNKYNSNPQHKQPLAKKSLVRGADTQEAILPDGRRKRLLVLDQDQDRHKDFVMSFRNRGGEDLMIDPASMGLFYFLATTIMDYRNVCEITAETCAAKINKSVKTTKRYLAELTDTGYIKRIKPGIYMLSPYRTIQVRKKYFRILETAWETGLINDIRPAMERLDEKIREETARNKALVKKAEASVLKKRITIPEAPVIAVNEEEELDYMIAVKESELDQQRAELAEKIMTRQGQRQLQ